MDGECKISEVFYQQLVESLRLPEIQETLRRICAGGPADAARLERENAALREQLAGQRQACLDLEEQARESARLRDALRRSEAELVRLREEAAELRQRRAGLEQDLRELTGRARELERDLGPFRELNELWERCRTLPGGAGEEAGKFLPREDPMRFFAVGCQRETIFRLWDLLCRRCQQGEDGGAETLLEALAFLLKCYNFNYTAPALELMTEEAGRPFDKDRHLRAPSCSPYQGQVEQVLLPGIWNRNKGFAERKCLVCF